MSDHPDLRAARRRRERERAARRRAARRRRRLTSAASLLLLLALAAGAVALLRREPGPQGNGRVASHTHTSTSSSSSTSTTTTSTRRPPPPRAPFAVGLIRETFVEPRKTVQYGNGETGPRELVTEIRYPATGPAGAPGAHAIEKDAPATQGGPYPLVIFGHGFERMPSEYATLLNAWARAGYVVAAPIFPLENKNAPGGPDRNDLVNEPDDMRFLIGEMLTEDESEGTMHELIAQNEIAVSGQSDGGDAALTVAYDPTYRDHLVKAALILSGAEMPRYLIPPIAFESSGPPLLAIQGTADTTNFPSETDAYFQKAPEPKYLLELVGAGHLEPYTTTDTYAQIVQRVTLDFLNGYLKGNARARAQIHSAGDVSQTSDLQAYP
ncbi:MAG: alpha/beta hydrolase family protein [Solirubrobacteraceae bacterium]